MNRHILQQSSSASSYCSIQKRALYTIHDLQIASNSKLQLKMSKIIQISQSVLLFTIIYELHLNYFILVYIALQFIKSINKQYLHFATHKYISKNKKNAKKIIKVSVRTDFKALEMWQQYYFFSIFIKWNGLLNLFILFLPCFLPCS